MGVQYEPAVIVESANRLYSKADDLVSSWAFRFGALGLAFGTLLAGGAKLGGFQLYVGVAALLIPTLIAAALGAAYGKELGFTLRLRAQEALCQLQIEINTRPR